MNIFLSILQFAFITNYLTKNKDSYSTTNVKSKLFFSRNYSPFGRKYYEDYIKKLNSKNVTIQNNYILNIGSENSNNQIDNQSDLHNDVVIKNINNTSTNNNYNKQYLPRKIIIRQIDLKELQNQIDINFNNTTNNNIEDDDSNQEYYDMFGNLMRKNHQEYQGFNRNRNGGGNEASKKSDNFEVITNHSVNFKNIGGYDIIKSELNQCVDLLVNYKKYSDYNVRTPKGLILEGPPGNGKTLLAKGFAGECKTGFIAVSGSQFQDKYVGVGSARVRELFELAKKNTPCIIFIDEIDAIGRKRSGEGEAAASERDSTLNELLVNLDGFSTKNGIFLMGATNRADLLDPALIRPGRIDRKIEFPLPDIKTKRNIFNIHTGKMSLSEDVDLEVFVMSKDDLSGADIKAVCTEAGLLALRERRMRVTQDDFVKAKEKTLYRKRGNIPEGLYL